jgi:hypothetical protein
MLPKHHCRAGLCLVVVLLCGVAAPAVAEGSAPKLKLATAKKVTKEIAIEVGIGMDGTVFGDGTQVDVREWSVGPCSRKSRRRIVCRYDLYSLDTASDGTSEEVDCWARLTVKYAGKTGRRLRVSDHSGDCRLDPGGSRGRHPLPPRTDS